MIASNNRCSFVTLTVSRTRWADQSGNGNNATIVGGPTYTANSGFTLDGFTQYLKVDNYTDSFSFEVPLTIMAWVRPSSAIPANYTIMSKYDYLKYRTTPTSNGGQTIYQSSSPSQSNTQTFSLAYSADTWQMVTITMDINTSSMYKNGTLISTYNFFSPQMSNIGSNPGAAFTLGVTRNDFLDQKSEYFSGRFGSVFVYKSLLSTAQIRDNYLATKYLYGV